MSVVLTQAQIDELRTIAESGQSGARLGMPRSGCPLLG